jgi:hypothetical protein
MHRPDFACNNLDPLKPGDLRFLIDHFPEPGKNLEEIATVLHQFPNTLDSMLDSEYVAVQILNRRDELLNISPFLLFNVLLRRTLGRPRGSTDRSVVNYLANLLALFVHSDRVHRITRDDRQTYEYLFDMVAAAAEADPQREFLLHSHIGNYALYLTGMFPGWIEYRHRYRRRPVNMDYYIDMGRAHFQQAATHRLAGEFGMDAVLFRLAVMFDTYRSGIRHMARDYLTVN